MKTWSWQLTHKANEPLPGVAEFTEGRGYYKSEDELVAQLTDDLLAGEKVAGRKPCAMIMGALGRCGRGACDLLIKAGVPQENLVKWDIDETRDNPGPYKEVADSDIFVNAVSWTIGSRKFRLRADILGSDLSHRENPSFCRLCYA